MDKFEIIMFALTEFALGNKAFFEIYKNAVNIIKEEFEIQSVLEVVEEIEEMVNEKYLKERWLDMEYRILDKTGDTKVVFDKNVPEEVEAAKA